jgi:hypothetical protein
MIHAFLILVHKNPNQVDTLINTLTKMYPNSYIFLHINSKSVNQFNDLKVKYHRSKCIKFLTSEINIVWGNSGLLRAQLFLLNHCLSLNVNFDYFFYLSGQDFPINNNLTKFLTYYNFDALFSSKKDTKWRRKLLLTRIPRIFIKDLGKKTNFLRILRSFFLRLNLQKFGFFRIKNSKLISRINTEVFYSGFFWVAFNYSTAIFIKNYIYTDPDFLTIFLNSNFLSEECFWPTILNKYKDFNKDAKFFDDLMYVKNTIDNHPTILTKSDFTTLISRPNKFFARKFDLNTDQYIIDLLINHLLKTN